PRHRDLRSFPTRRSSDLGAAVSNGIYSVRGGGAGISGTSDSFHFMYQPISGDAQMTARILSQDPTDNSAKAGVMLRETLDPVSRDRKSTRLNSSHVSTSY